ncbi:protein lin-28 homolog isoform X2 [Centruroides sculpturatus]|uniref:protein lin-28 homolog isoform X2 n=1 Tax=Centruroides sculpturatus TaxID=218467 RepID=UPI000C6D55B7|nr:protein lin-28 homolog isoform X2 [Centruroides sculpturatus]
MADHSSNNGEDVAGGSLGSRRRGKCKWFNVAKGWGFITPYDGGPDVFVHQSVIKMSGFRSLGDDEEVEFECKVSDKGLEATIVTGPNGQDCKGSHRRPMSKKRFRKIRCYNCGEFANHIAAKCTLGPQPKRCHHCKSVDHLIAECPLLEEKKKTKNGDSSTNNNKDGSNNHRTATEAHDVPGSSGTSTEKRKV